jgi:hypothetical protein
VVVRNDPPPRDYSACRAAVLAGKTTHLAVGVSPQEGDYSIAELKKDDGTPLAKGRYRCWLDKHGPVLASVDGPPPAAPVSWDDHACPKCGTAQNVHSATNADGSHSHTCPACKYTWWHGGPLGYPGTRPSVQQTPQVVQPQTGLPPPGYGGLQFGGFLRVGG